MDLDPAEKSWGERHPYIKTVFLVVLILAAGVTLKILQGKYMTVEEKVYKTPVFMNESFYEVNSHFGINSNLSEEEQDALFEESYQYNLFEWSCRPVDCETIIGKHSLKLICNDRSYAEDLRVMVKEDCVEVAREPEVTVRFQLISRTIGSYYLGRSGVIIP
ncbi:MAG: hypothetical protein V1729_06290 [Candidatus Woesearchaeota archaeon]